MTRAVQLANDIDIRQCEFANTLENGWWEEKHKRRADLITLICKLSGKRCNQIIRILSDNWEKDIICNNYYIIYIWQKQIIFHSDYETGFRLAFLKCRIRYIVYIFFAYVIDNVIVHFPYTFHETLRRLKVAMQFSHIDRIVGAYLRRTVMNQL